MYKRIPCRGEIYRFTWGHQLCWAEIKSIYFTEDSQPLVTLSWNLFGEGKPSKWKLQYKISIGLGQFYGGLIN